MSGNVFVGTSGWHYKHWKGPFYPEDMSTTKFLEYYAARFRSAEINNSFYNLPSRDTLKEWGRIAGDDFIFSFKASRFLTHMKKLKDPEEPLRNVYESAEALEDSLGPILFQLPPNWAFNAERLEHFLSILSRHHRHVFEFRDKTWIDPEAIDLLRQYNAAFCIYELGGFESPRVTTADFVYVRLHGPGKKYEGRYDRQTLGAWAGAIHSWTDHVGDVYCYFDNDQDGYAAMNAGELLEMTP